MRATIFSLVAAATLALAENAPIVANNPAGASYVAKLPAKEGSTVAGSLTAVTANDGRGVLITVAISGLPKEGGPFMYHVHEKPVPSDGNCTGAGPHLDPYKRGEQPICDKSKPETCQTGDLSGKHGNITDESYAVTYNDLYLATALSDPSYLGNLSLVVHLSNKTRISCANFSLIAEGVPSPSQTSAPVSVGTSSGYALPTGGHNSTSSASPTVSGTNAPTGTPISPTSTPSIQPSSGAQKLVAGAGLFVAAVAVMLL